MFTRLSKIIAASVVAIGMSGAASAATLGSTIIAPIPLLGTPGAFIDIGNYGPNGSVTSIIEELDLGLSIEYHISDISADGNVFEHDGTQLVLTEILIPFLEDRDPAVATAKDFVVDLNQFKVFGDVFVGDPEPGSPTVAGLHLFDIALPNEDGLIEGPIFDAGFVRLEYSEDFVGPYNDIFTPLLDVHAGQLFGYAKVNPAPTPIPLPASSLLLIAGVGAMGAVRVRKKKQ